MIGMHSKYNNMHKNVMFYAFISISNHINFMYKLLVISAHNYYGLHFSLFMTNKTWTHGVDLDVSHF